MSRGVCTASMIIPTILSTRSQLGFNASPPEFSSCLSWASRKEAFKHAGLVSHGKISLKNAEIFPTPSNSVTKQNIYTSCGRRVFCRHLYSVALTNDSPEADSSSLPSEEHEPNIDLNLPRRRLQVSFTCDACGERSQRIINPHAYARGTVFVQCAGCEAYHKLVDNLGLIEEYDFRLETIPKVDGAEG
ncbi:hypothetical protein L7F22_040970 [Adiantum nelumboides]|nr:hypothetical protein [Adiantum nelumboides]